jgi:ubiquinone/menaquinone biosynthesis C-methylase UbiE
MKRLVNLQHEEYNLMQMNNKTDYSKIASRYDNNPLRQKPVDKEIAQLLQNRKQLSVLDIACGTGNYLYSQIKEYGTENISWTGIDQSEDMLHIARTKVPEAKFFCSSAEQIPLADASFDYIRNEYSFHHFNNKMAFLKNVHRLLRDNGLLIMVNICRDYIKNSWVYHYFPSAENVDESKFIRTKDMYTMMHEAGFAAEIKISTTVAPLDFSARIAEAENRDMSQLQHISDKEYKDGLKRMKHDYKNKISFIADYSELVCRAEKNKKRKQS